MKSFRCLLGHSWIKVGRPELVDVRELRTAFFAATRLPLFEDAKAVMQKKHCTRCGKEKWFEV